LKVAAGKSISTPIVPNTQDFYDVIQCLDPDKNNYTDDFSTFTITVKCLAGAVPPDHPSAITNAYPRTNS